MKRIAFFFLCSLLLPACDFREEPESGFAQLRLISLLSEAPSVDAFLDGERIAIATLSSHPNTPSPGPEDPPPYLEVDAGRHRIEIKLATSPGTPLLSERISLEDEAFHTIFVTGPSAEPALVLAEDDLTPAELDRARVRLVHAYPDFASLRVGIHQVAETSPAEPAAPGEELHRFNAVSFGDATAYASLREDKMAMVLNNSQNELLGVFFTSLTLGMLHTIVITRPPVGAPEGAFGTESFRERP